MESGSPPDGDKKQAGEKESKSGAWVEMPAITPSTSAKPPQSPNNEETSKDDNDSLPKDLPNPLEKVKNSNERPRAMSIQPQGRKERLQRSASCIDSKPQPQHYRKSTGGIKSLKSLVQISVPPQEPGFRRSSFVPQIPSLFATSDEARTMSTSSQAAKRRESLVTAMLSVSARSSHNLRSHSRKCSRSSTNYQNNSHAHRKRRESREASSHVSSAKNSMFNLPGANNSQGTHPSEIEPVKKPADEREGHTSSYHSYVSGEDREPLASDRRPIQDQVIEEEGSMPPPLHPSGGTGGRRAQRPSLVPFIKDQEVLTHRLSSIVSGEDLERGSNDVDRKPLDESKVKYQTPISSVKGTHHVVRIEEQRGEERQWRDSDGDRITFAELMRIGKTGDVLLFENKDCVNVTVRNCLCMKYNHVAMLIRVPGEPLTVCETLGNTGVAIFKFSDFFVHRWYMQYKSMKVRLLELDSEERYEQVDCKIQDWLERALNRPYRWTPKMFCRCCLGKTTLEKEMEKPKFFCSELVACAFKVGGILPEDDPCVTYGPRMFQANHDLINARMRNKSSLGQEREIVFPDEDDDLSPTLE